jgi:membrane protein DedA with SNARE-associated domain/rhodanese-related sulfurtransferase
MVMALPTHFLLVYGYLLLFVWVLVEQLGIPIPASPVMLAAGALSAEGSMRFFLAFAAVVVAAVISDTTWFLLGRRYGHRILRRLCKLSLEPNTCIRRTQDSVGRRGAVMLLFAKFVPGLALLAPPIAGQYRMPALRFVFFDALGSSIWAATLLLGGRFFGDALNHNPAMLAWAGRFSGVLLLTGIIGFFVARILRRRATLRKLAASRIEPEELKRKLDAGEQVYIVDLRHPLEMLTDPYTLPGALQFAPQAIAERHQEIPRDRDIVLFCTCPSEATAARTSLLLLKHGIERVRPLRGGYDEWKRLGFPLDDIPPSTHGLGHESWHDLKQAEVAAATLPDPQI